MEREDIAKIINCKIAGLTRLQGSFYKNEWQEGQILEVGKDLGMCWSDGGEFKPETDAQYLYLLEITNEVSGHKVNYDDEDEVYDLGAEGCEAEKEVLIPEERKFEIIYIANDYDFGEMGYYTVKLKAVE